MLERLTREDLLPYVGNKFRLSTEDQPIFEIELHAVEAVGGTPNQREPFSALFLAPAEPFLQQAIYTLEHESIGPLTLFLVPLGPFQDGMKYEAVFT